MMGYRFVNATVLLSSTIVASAALAQIPRPSFEVASIKRNLSGVFWNQGIQPGGRFVATNSTLADVILLSYEVRDVNLLGGPAWVRSDRFDIKATAGRPATDAEIRLMLQSLLADRFQLVVRREQREMPVYEVLRNREDGRLGPNILQLAPGEDCRTAATRLASSANFQKAPAGATAIRGQACGEVSSALADLASYLRTPIVDKTGLTGTWVLLPYFGADQTIGRGQVADPNLPSFFTAWQEQLGLRLRSTRAVVDVLAIASVEPPTEN